MVGLTPRGPTAEDPTPFRVYTFTTENVLPSDECVIGASLVDRRNYKTAAPALGAGVNTISVHVRRAYGKPQIHSESEAVARALRDRVILRPRRPTLS